MRKSINTTLILIIIVSFLAQEGVYAGDGVCLRVPIKRDQDRMYISMLTEQAKSDVDILSMLRPSTRKIFDILIVNQRKIKEEVLRSLLESHAVKFDAVLFCELYVICKFYDWDSHRQLKYLAAERDYFVLQMILHAAVLEKLDFSPGEMSVLDRYVSVPGDRNDEAADPELSAKAMSVILSKKPKRDYDVLSRYLGMLSGMASEVNRHDILAKDDVGDVFCARTEKLGYGLLKIYIAAREAVDTNRHASWRSL